MLSAVPQLPPGRPSGCVWLPKAQESLWASPLLFTTLDVGGWRVFGPKRCPGEKGTYFKENLSKVVTGHFSDPILNSTSSGNSSCAPAWFRPLLLLCSPGFLFLKIYVFIYLFLAALGLHCCMRAFSSCGEQGLLFVLIAVASLVAEHGLSVHGLQ